MKDEVFLDNLPRTANQILNVLWNRNREMGVDELTDALNQDYVVRLGRREVQRFVRLLLHAEYIEAKKIRISHILPDTGVGVRGG